jgi:hypothetical protein
VRYGNLYKGLLICFLLVVAVAFVFQLTKKQTKNKLELTIVNETVEGTTEAVSEDPPKSASEVKEIDQTMTYPEYPSDLKDEDINPEAYNPYSSLEIKCYFTNTENTLDKPGAFPLKAQGRLLKDIQKFLDENEIGSEELRCIDGSLQEDSFVVQCVETNVKIKVIYLRDVEIWKFKNEGQ